MKEPDAPLCECGCGNPVKKDRQTGWRRWASHDCFLRGHKAAQHRQMDALDWARRNGMMNAGDY